MPCELKLAGLKVLRPGLHLGTVKKKRFEPAHALALALRAEEVKRTASYPADSGEIRSWLSVKRFREERAGLDADSGRFLPSGLGKAGGRKSEKPLPKRASEIRKQNS